MSGSTRAGRTEGLSVGRRRLPRRVADRLRAHRDGQWRCGRPRRSARRRAARRPMSRWGSRGSASASAFMGQVGEDGFGRFLADTLRRGGRRYRAAPLRPGRGRRWPSSRWPPTATASSCSTAIPARTRCSRRRISTRRRSPARKVLHYGSISLIGEPSRSATLHAIELARQHGVRRSYDPEPAGGALAEPRMRPGTG